MKTTAIQDASLSRESSQYPHPFYRWYPAETSSALVTNRDTVLYNASFSVHPSGCADVPKLLKVSQRKGFQPWQVQTTVWQKG